MALKKACAQCNNPDPDQRSEESRKGQGHSSQLNRVTGSSVVERDTRKGDNSRVERGQDKTKNASRSKATRETGNELDRSRDDAVASRHRDSFLQKR